MPQPSKPKNTKPRNAIPPIELDLGPGAAMRALVEEEKRKKRSRLRKRIAIALVALLVLGYLGVTTFVFNPLEGTTIAFQNLVPRGSDFFARKVNLADDLPLPPTAITPLHEGATIWSAFEAGKLFLQASDVKALVNGYRELMGSFTGVPIDPVRDLAGREVAIAGFFPEKSGGLGASRFGLYLRVSWRVRAAMGLVRYAAFRSAALPGVKIERLASGTLRVLGAAGGRDLFVSRDRDLLLIASDEKWIEEATQLGMDRGEGSFGQGAIYADEIQSRLNMRQGVRSAPPSNLQLLVRVPALRRTIGDTTPWPDPKSPSMIDRFFASCFSTALPEEVASLVRFEKDPRRAIAIDSFSDLNSGVLDEFGKRLYAERPLQQADFKRLAQMTPQSSFAFGMATLSGGALGRHIESLLAPEDRRAIDDAFRRTGKYDSLRAAIEDFAVAVGDRVVVLAHENVFPADAKDPKNDGGPQPAIAVAFPQRSPDKVKQLREFFIANKQHFGIEETIKWPQSGYELMEYYSPLVPGTGEVALLVANNWVFLSNQAKFLRKIMSTWLLTARADDRPYEEDAAYQALLQEHEQIANACVYMSGPKLAKALRPYVDWWVREAGFGDPAQQRAEREALFQRVLQEKYPQYVGQNVPVNIRAEVDKAVDERMEQKAKARSTGNDSAARQRYLETLKWIEAVPAAFVSLRFDPKHASLYARVDVD